MSQPKLTLRPPPNVDFVQGYPGIPPGGPDRPQAAVKGAIEVRVGQQGVKAKWVRIELRKIETLPGGGVANTFFDFVGQSPINLWQSPNDEYSTLHTNDFPFFIRIPESIPPTIVLEKGAGVKYELIASVCVQGKKGFLRRDKPTVTATASTIIIDKHELHSTWPIYSQPETRSHSQDGVTLLVERGQTCYGPGDRVTLMATVKSDTVHTVMLRGIEFALRETTIFRAAPHTQGKKGNPQVKPATVGEQKVPVNVRLYGGTQHKAELNITVPAHHTSATITSARHIDINYVLTVKALMDGGQPIVMDLPVMISNWPRTVSVEAMRRIGQAFNVSLPNQPGAQRTTQSPSGQQDRFAPALMGRTTIATITATPKAASHASSSSIDKKGSVSDFRSPPKSPLGQFSTAPSASEKNSFGYADEFGGRKRNTDVNGGQPYAAQTIGATNYSGSGASRTRAGSSASSNENNASPAARPRSSSGRVNPAQRLTIVNMSEDEVKEHMEAEMERARRQPSVILESPIATAPATQLTQSHSYSAKPSSDLGSRWMTAEQEKEALYKRAVERVQDRTRNSVDSQSANAPSASTHGPLSAGSKSQVHWPTAEEEKAKLFEQAQAAVARARGLEASDYSSAFSPGMAGSSSMQSGSGRAASMSTGAALYSEAMSAINRPLTSSDAGLSPSTPGSVRSSSSTRQSTSSALPSAADEKAMLQRYYEAKTAVYQTQSAQYGRVPGNAEPMPYDTLYPDSPTPSNAYSIPSSPPEAQSPADMPPSFAAASGSSSRHPILSEKERLRRHYEAQDAAATQQQQQQQQQHWQPAPPPDEYTSPPSPYQSMPMPALSDIGRYSTPPPTGNLPPFSAFSSPLASSQPMSAFAEKELLRRQYEQQDAAALGSPLPTPTPPPRSSQLLNGAGGRGRPPPTPPISPGTPVSARPLTAAEEKARLKAVYEGEERGMDSSRVHMPVPAQSPYPSPPPSNGYHSERDRFAAPRTTPSPQPPAPPPLAPKPPREYIEETQAEDLRTSAKLQAIDNGDPSNVIASLKQADPDLASLAPSELELEQDEVADADARDNTFGPGTLPGLASHPSLTVTTPSPSPLPTSNPLSRSTSLAMSGAIPPPPPLPPKVLIE